MARRDLAIRTFQRMEDFLVKRGYTPTDSHIEVGIGERVLYKGGIKSYQAEGPMFPDSVTVTLLLSEPYSVNRSLGSCGPDGHIRWSIEARAKIICGTVDYPQTQILYGHFARGGKPIDKHAKELQEKILSDPRLIRP